MNIEYCDVKTAIADFIEGFKEIEGNADPLNYLLIVAQTQQMTIENLFQELQTYFLSLDPTIKSRASLLVMMIFQRLPELMISDEQFIFLSTFFINQLHKPETTTESSTIVYLLFQRFITQESQLYMGLVDRFLMAIKSDEFQVPRYPQGVRINIYRILTILCRVYPQHIKSLGSDFISTILKVTESEMDPRNILFVFDLIKFILNEFDAKILVNYKNVIFEQLDCYYPIEFDENMDKRFSIKSSQLCDALNACLSSPHILGQVMLSLEEKLSSSFHVAQQASLQTIQSIFHLNATIDPQIYNKIWVMMESFLEHLIETDFEDDYVKAVKAILFYLNIGLSANDLHLEDKMIQYLIQAIQDKPLSINAGLALSCFMEAQTVCKRMDDKVMTNIFRYFVGKISFKDHPVAQTQIQSVLLVVQKSLAKYQQVLFYDQILLQKVIMTLQEALVSDVEDIIVLALKSLIEVHKLLENHQILDAINVMVLQLMRDSESTILRMCCIDFLGTIPQSDLQSLLGYFEQDLSQEFVNYSKPILFKLFPHIYKHHKEQLKSLLSTQDDQFEQKHLVPILKFIMQSSNLPEQEFEFYLQLFLNQPNSQYKKSEKSIIKSLVDVYKKKQQPIYEKDLTQNLGWVLDHLDKTSFINILVDNSSEYVQQKSAMQILDYYTDLKFSFSEKNVVNSKNFCKLLKRVAMSDFDKVRDIASQNPVEIYLKFSSNGISQFECYCMVMRVGLCQQDTHCWSAVQSQIYNDKEVDQYTIDLLNNVIDGKHNKIDNYWICVMEKIVLPSLSFKESPKLDELICSLLIKVEPSILKQYNDYWHQFLSIIKSRLLMNTGLYQLEPLIKVVLAISRFSDGSINVIPLLLDVLKSNVLDMELIGRILVQIGNNSSLGRNSLELQQTVINTFKSYLDHHKRIIRKSAQFGINAWFMIGSKGM